MKILIFFFVVRFCHLVDFYISVFSSYVHGYAALLIVRAFVRTFVCSCVHYIRLHIRSSFCSFVRSWFVRLNVGSSFRSCLRSFVPGSLACSFIPFFAHSCFVGHFVCFSLICCSSISWFLALTYLTFNNNLLCLHISL